MTDTSYDIAIVGSGIVGIATAYYLTKQSPDKSVVLIDSHQPMQLTSSHSGENYRNWWPHPVMTAFTNRSIDLMEELAYDDENRINMTRRGYVLATRENSIDTLLSELEAGYAEDESNVRIHDSSVNHLYEPALASDWIGAPNGVDVLSGSKLIQQHFPSIDNSIQSVVHVRRAGSISSQQMGQIMLAGIKQAGGVRLQVNVGGIDKQDGFTLFNELGERIVTCAQLINAAGPFINEIAHMLGTDLPVSNTLQQKIAFEDTHQCIPRNLPFSIDLDAQYIDWTVEEKQLLCETDEHAWLTDEMPGSIHCRPDGGDAGSWIKLGWAFNNVSANALREPVLPDAFPEIVLRGAARMHPALKVYYDRLPGNFRHYGGYYTLTNENWPLIGTMAVQDSFVVGAMSGFGTMAACAAGDLCARIISEQELPDYADALAPQRYVNKELMQELSALSQRGIL
jgi:glycine/D-amino acid oxidase-like deaminating enzyme